MDSISIHEELEDAIVDSVPSKSRLSLYKDIKEQRPVWKLLLAGPFIWGMIFPLMILDISLEIYHNVAFRLYGIKLLDRKKYIIVDRHHLTMLNIFEKMNCMYCGYANGLLPYAKDITAETEKYWCALKHEKNMQDIQPQQEGFLDREDFA